MIDWGNLPLHAFGCHPEVMRSLQILPRSRIAALDACQHDRG